MVKHEEKTSAKPKVNRPKSKNMAHQPKRRKKSEKKIEKVLHEYKEGELHSGSQKGPVVKKKDQAIAIALSEAGKSKKRKKK